MILFNVWLLWLWRRHADVYFDGVTIYKFFLNIFLVPDRVPGFFFLFKMQIDEGWYNFFYFFTLKCIPDFEYFCILPKKFQIWVSAVRVSPALFGIEEFGQLESLCQYKNLCVHSLDFQNITNHIACYWFVYVILMSFRWNSQICTNSLLSPYMIAWQFWEIR